MENIQFDPENIGMAHLETLPSDEGIAGSVEISTITGKPVKSKLMEASEPAWKSPWESEDYGDRPTTFWGSIGHTLRNGIEIATAPVSLAFGTAAGINRGKKLEEAAQDAWSYYTSWMEGSHEQEDLATKSFREIFMPMYPEGSPAVESLSAIATTVLDPMLGLARIPKMLKDSKRVFAPIAKALNKTPEELIKRGVTADEMVIALNNSEVQDAFAKTYQFEHLNPEDELSWSSVLYRTDTKQGLEKSIVQEMKAANYHVAADNFYNERPIEAMTMETNQRFPIDPLYYRSKYLDLNSVDDVMKDWGHTLRETIDNIQRFRMENLKAPGYRNQLRAFSAGLKKQPEYLRIRLGVDSPDQVVPLTKIEALAANKYLDRIDQNIFYMLRMEHKYKFASPIDRLRLHKLIAARQTFVGALTGERYPVTRWLRMLDTSAPVSGNKILRKYKIEMAMNRVPNASITKKIRFDNLLNAVRPGLPSDELTKLGKKFSGYFDSVAANAQASALLGESMIKDMGTLTSARAVSTYMREITKKVPGLDVSEKLYRARVEAALSNPWLPVRTAIANAALTARMPINDLAASIVKFTSGDLKGAQVAAGSGVHRILGAIEGFMDGARLAAQDFKEVSKVPTNKNVLKNRFIAAHADNIAEGKLNPDDFRGFFEVSSSESSLNPYHVPYLTRDRASKMDWSSKALLHNSYVNLARQTGEQVLPSGLLQKLDLIFKAVNYRSRLHADAWRIASQTGKSVYEIGKIKENLLRNPTERMVASAWGEGLRNTLQQPIEGVWETPSRIAGAIDTASAHITNGVLSQPTRWFWMFRQSSTNAVRELIESTPVVNALTLLNPNSRIRKMLAAGGADRDFAIGQLAFSNTLLLSVFFWQTEGRVTGDGGLPERGSAHIRQPSYMMRIGDYQFYYGHIEPLRWTLGTAMSAKEIWLQTREDDPEDDRITMDMIAGLTAILAEAGLNRYTMADMLKAFANTYEAIAYNRWYPMRPWFLDTPQPAASFIRWLPEKTFGGYRVWNEMSVPDRLIETNAIDRALEAVFNETKQKLGIPLGRHGDSTRFDLLGAPYRKNELSGYYGIRDDLGDVVRNELAVVRPRLHDVHRNSSIGEFTAPERQQMREAIVSGKVFGVPLKANLLTLINSPDYKEMNLTDKRHAIEQIWNNYRDEARNQIIGGN